MFVFLKSFDDVHSPISFLSADPARVSEIRKIFKSDEQETHRVFLHLRILWGGFG